MFKKATLIGALIFSLLPFLLMGAQSDEKKLMVKTENEGPWLGVQIEKLSAKMLKNLNLEYGVLVKKVIRESPAEEAGLQEDDIILSFEGSKVNDPDELIGLVKKCKIDQKVAVEYYRTGSKQKATAKLAENNSMPMVKMFKGGPGLHHPMPVVEKRAWLGVKAEDLNEQLRTFFGAPDDLGVMVKEVVKESPAEKTGLKAGDVIIQVADRKINSTRDLVRSINYYDPEEVVQLTIIRDKKEKKIKVTLGETGGKNSFMFQGKNFDWIEAPDMDIDIPEMNFSAPDVEAPVEVEVEITPEVDNLQGDNDKNVKARKIMIRKEGNEI